MSLPPDNLSETDSFGHQFDAYIYSKLNECTGKRLINFIKITLIAIVIISSIGIIISLFSISYQIFPKQFHFVSQVMTCPTVETIILLVACSIGVTAPWYCWKKLRQFEEELRLFLLMKKGTVM